MRGGDGEPAAASPGGDDPAGAARAVVLRMLTGAPRSRKQLSDALARRGFEEDVVERVLDRFDEVGLVDDAEYARMVVRSQHESRGLARRALGMELRRRGVGEADAQEALTQVDDDDEERQARQLVAKRWRTTAGLPAETRVRRISGMLARKGYSSSLVSRLLREQREADLAAGEDLALSESESRTWEDSVADPE